MPSPFDNNREPAPDLPGAVKVTDSQLVCDKCFDFSTEGYYYAKEKLLVFTCNSGHHNEVRLEL